MIALNLTIGILTAFALFFAGIKMLILKDKFQEDSKFIGLLLGIVSFYTLIIQFNMTLKSEGLLSISILIIVVVIFIFGLYKNWNNYYIKVYNITKLSLEDKLEELLNKYDTTFDKTYLADYVLYQLNYSFTKIKIKHKYKDELSIHIYRFRSFPYADDLIHDMKAFVYKDEKNHYLISGILNIIYGMTYLSFIFWMYYQINNI